jgi:hypothetical protein
MEAKRSPTMLLVQMVYATYVVGASTARIFEADCSRFVCAVGGTLDIVLPQHIIENANMIRFVGATSVFDDSIPS